MDRDEPHGERVERLYRAVVHGDAPLQNGRSGGSHLSQLRTRRDFRRIHRSYRDCCGRLASAPPVGPIHDYDAAFFFNFRADRARQMTRAIAEPVSRNLPTRSGPPNFFTLPDAVRQVLALNALYYRAGKNAQIFGASFRRAKPENLRLRGN